MPFDARQVPGGDLWQIFVNDPNGVMIELNYEAAKEQTRIGALDAGRTTWAGITCERNATTGSGCPRQGEPRRAAWP